MTKTIKAEYLPGGEKRQELLEQVPGYLQSPGADHFMEPRPPGPYSNVFSPNFPFPQGLRGSAIGVPGAVTDT